MLVSNEEPILRDGHIPLKTDRLLLCCWAAEIRMCLSIEVYLRQDLALVKEEEPL